MKWHVLDISGTTIDGLNTVSGCFKLLDTYGIPLAITVAELHEHGLMVDWISFCEDALKAGWKLRAAIARLREAVGDTYSRDWILEWEKHIEIYRQLREEAEQ